MQTPMGATLEQYHAALGGDLDVATTVSILNDDDHSVVSEVTGVARGGQINWADAEVSRSLSGLELFDPAFELHLDSSSPDDGAVYADRFVQVSHTISSPALTAPATVHSFTGPLVKFTRSGPVVTLEAQGKEQRARTDVPNLTVPRGAYIVDAIRDIMEQRCGERFFRFPSGVTDRLKKPVSVGAEDEAQPWVVCQKLAKQINMQLFYDGAGVLVLRHFPTLPVFDVVTLSPVTLSHDWSTVYNRALVQWRRKKAKGSVVVSISDSEVAPGHPFSPSAMGRDGIAWNRTLVVEGENVASPEAARQIGVREMRQQANQALELTVSGVPAWHLDPMDVVNVDGYAVPLREASVGIVGGEMSLGAVRRVGRPRRR